LGCHTSQRFQPRKERIQPYNALESEYLSLRAQNVFTVSRSLEPRSPFLPSFGNTGKTLAKVGLFCFADWGDKEDESPTLLFVDTNIFLNFYRARGEAGLTLLERLETVATRSF